MVYGGVLATSPVRHSPLWLSITQIKEIQRKFVTHLLRLKNRNKEERYVNFFLSFAEHANKIRLVGPGSSSAESSSNAADEAAASECSSSSRLSDQPAKDWTTANVATLMSTALEPQLEASLKQKRHLDRIRVQQIIRATTSSTSE